MIRNEQSHPEAVQNLDVHFGQTWVKIWVLGSGEPLEDLIHLGKLQCFHFARQFGLEMAMKTKCLINDNEVCPEHIMN